MYLLARCEQSSLYFFPYFYINENTSTSKTWASEVPSCKPKYTILQIRHLWILHSFADYDAVLIGYGTGSTFPISCFWHYEGTRFLYLQLHVVEPWIQCCHLQKSRADLYIRKLYISSKLQRNITLWLRIMFNTNWVSRLWIEKRKFKKGNYIYLVNIWVRNEMLNPTKENESTTHT